MRMVRLAASVSLMLGLLALGGCISETKYAAISEAYKGSPALRREELRRCNLQARAAPIQRAKLAVVMNLPPRSDPVPVLCRRMIESVASGKLSYEDYRTIRAGQITPKLVRILQGR